MLVKICGIKDHHFLQHSSSLKFDLAGFIFYPKSARYIVNEVDPTELELLPSSVKIVGVFVNELISTVNAIAEDYDLDFIQLHGDETPEYVEQLSKKYKIIKAFRIDGSFDFESVKPYEDFCDYFLFDTKAEQYGGTGVQFNWEVLSNYKGSTPFLLSGGIGLDDVEKVKQFKHPKFVGVDINSKFEIQPGIKNLPEISNFLKQLS